MPALNVQFTEAELAQLRKRAKMEGQAMTTLVHDSAVNCGTRAEQRDLIRAAYAEAKVISAGLLRRLAVR
jgi:hypothetical protein